VLSHGSPEEIVLEVVRAREPTDVNSVVQRSGLAVSVAREALGRLLETGDILLLDNPNGTSFVDGRGFLISASGWRRLTEQVETLLGNYHRAYPLRRGLPREELRTRLGTEPRLFVRELERLNAQGVAAEDGPFVRLATHKVQFSPAQVMQVNQLLGVLREAGVSPPDRVDLEAELRVSPELVDALIVQGQVIEVAAGLLYERESLEKIVAGIRADIEEHGPRSVAQIRDLLDASRKFTLALINYTDEHKITRRVGDERVVY
jgi:selenocysteine-specific elongation factor